MASPRPVPPYLRLVLPSACWKASKMICCLSAEMPMPVSRHRERDDLGGAVQGFRSADSTPISTGLDRERDVPFVRELEGVRQEVLQHLLQALRIGEHRPRQVRILANEEVDVLGLGDVTERALDIAAQLIEHQVGGLDRHGSGLDLRQVEDVVDQREQIVPGRVDGLGELDLLSPSGCRLGVPAELIGQDQQAVERRAQLVRHVGEEFGLVLRGQRELLGLLLQRLARLLDFLVLALDFLVLVGQASPAFSSSSWLVCCSSCCRLCNSCASDCDWVSRSTVRVLASIVLMTMPMLSASWSRKASCVGLKRSNDASSTTPLTWSSKITGSTRMFCGGARPSPEKIVM